MTAQRRRRALALLASAGLAAGVVPALATPAAAQEAEAVADGLANPRGISFGPDGALYVAESGSGGDECEDIPAPTEEDPEATAEACFGTTGAITRITGLDTATPTVERFGGLPSLALMFEEGAEIIGPSSVSVAPDGSVYTVIGLGADPAVRGEIENDLVDAFGSLHRVALEDGAATATKVADLADYEAENDPDADQPDNEGANTNPYAVLAVEGRAFVADAGGNDVLSVDTEGTGEGQISLVAVIGNEEATDPESGETYPYQPVPTSLAQLEDGSLLVGTLAFGGGPGAANVYRVHPGLEQVEVEVYEGGFNPISGVDTLGANLFVAELTAGFGPEGPLPGRVVRSSTSGDEALAAACPDQVLADEADLGPFIGGLAVSPDGSDVFVVNGSTTPEGTVLRVDAGLFEDVLGNTHEEAIQCLAGYGIIQGRTADTFAPAGTLTRGQAASLLARLVRETDRELPAGSDAFRDDDDSVHEDNINALAAADVIEGRTATTYEPNALVTRAQLASLTVRAAEFVTGTPLAAGDDAFTDDETSVHEAAINKAAAQGWIRGFDADTFGPQQDITRAQASSVVARVLSALVESGNVDTGDGSGDGAPAAG